jgi:hypothetical protein
VAVEVADGAGLAEMLHAERKGLVAGHRAEPGQRRRVAVDDRDNSAWRGSSPSSVSMWLRRLRVAAGARALCRGPAGVQPVRRGDGQHADIAPVIARSMPAASMASGATAALIGDDDLAVRPRLRSQ